jgi:hypothetical protein
MASHLLSLLNIGKQQSVQAFNSSFHIERFHLERHTPMTHIRTFLLYTPASVPRRARGLGLAPAVGRLVGAVLRFSPIKRQIPIFNHMLDLSSHGQRE